MNYCLVFSPMALDDFRDHTEYLLGENPPTADRFPDAVMETAERLLIFPQAYSRVDIDEVRELNLRRIVIREFRNHLLFVSD